MDFVRADAIDQPIEVLADSGFGATAERRVEQHLYRLVEVLFGGFEMPLFELGLTGFEVALGHRDQRRDRVVDRRALCYDV